jgi:hypothetical protein
MKRSNTMSVLNQGTLASYKQRVAYHEAGHAAAIHLNNRLKNLPPIFFKIILEDLESYASNTLLMDKTGRQDCIARIKGGRLIQGLPFAFGNEVSKSSQHDDALVFQLTDGYRLAFEADIVNLLIGPLAEAKHIALMDGETFSHQLLTAQALKNYGGEADLAIVNDYLQNYSADQQEQHKWMNLFLIQAFNFVNDKANWKSITRLANYILASHKNEISCEEAAAILDSQQGI